MPKHPHINSVLVIGSGPIIIGQAAEFDYSGTQACRTLREANCRVILVNNNPATIMTDRGIADVTYMDPPTLPYLTAIIERERPDALLPTLGGQLGLNLARELALSGVLAKYGVEFLGTPLASIERAEDRQEFKLAMGEIGEPVPVSRVAHSLEQALAAASEIGFPVIVRPAFTLGGTGGGHAHSVDELRAIVEQGLCHSPVGQVLIEASISGWKEIEFEVIRDAAQCAIAVCHMENLDPVGIHTGDSIVVAPCQTLSDQELQMLRSAALRIVAHLGIVGGCNVQLALHPTSLRYAVIEVNPRVSRSSALASKATGYPIAKVASLVSLGFNLDEIQNAITGTSACFEPALDYVVVKIPRWPFDKFASANKLLGSQMKATGEVMAIGRNFASALLKAVRSLELKRDGLEFPARCTDETLWAILEYADDERMFVIAELLRRGFTPALIQASTGIDQFWLYKLQEIVELEATIRHTSLDAELLWSAKRLGLTDERIAALKVCSPSEIMALRDSYGIRPVYKMVDTCAAEFVARTPYFYSTYETENEARDIPEKKVAVIGSGPIRIGQGVEFDYCSVHASEALRSRGSASIIINNNPETVSTDFDTSTRLYFEPLTAEDVLAVLKQERPSAVAVQFGGQTAVNLAATIEQAGFTLLGTEASAMHACEDRACFDAILRELDIPRPEGLTVLSIEEARQAVGALGLPVLLRPSYVLGGRSMAVVESEEQLEHLLLEATTVTPNHPVLIDRYLPGLEFEVDVLSDGQDVFIPGIMQHVERAGVHSGDSIAVYPATSLDTATEQLLVEYCRRMATRIGIRGLMNVQFVLYAGRLYVLEVNPRASRTVPFISKVTDMPLVKHAIAVMLGKTIREIGLQPGLLHAHTFYAVKMPVFSFHKLTGVETSLSPEMKSTGEAIGLAPTLPAAMRKAMQGAFKLPASPGKVLVSLADRDKDEGTKLARELVDLGFRLVATPGTAMHLKQTGLEVEQLHKVDEGHPNVLDMIKARSIQLIVNTPTAGKRAYRDGFRIRRMAAEYNVPCLTSLDTLAAYIMAVASDATPVPCSLNDFFPTSLVCATL
ncbi:MAG: Carbamoyl-phosphate synthase large chain [Firmicutes bacterium]|nr:Carbamoyl-phosphate synthase large chain [candidate division NPL-UPA2 bacterium]